MLEASTACPVIGLRSLCLLLVAVGIFLFAVVAGAPSASAQSTALKLGEPQEIIERGQIFRPIGVALTPEGDPILIDFSTKEILKVGPNGAVLWRTGRGGEGPGEFQILYRMDVAPDGRIVAFDMATREVSWFTDAGVFERRVQLPMRLRGIGQMIALSDGQIAITGVATYGGLHAVRIFDEEMRLVSSFGPLPPAKDDRVLSYWGAGGVSLAENGELLFTRKLPYEIYRYDPSGEELGTFVGPGEFTLGPDDAFIETSDGVEIGIAEAQEHVPFPFTAWSLGDGWILGGVATGSDEKRWDLFRDGELVESFPAPHGWIVVLVDRDRHLLYVATHDEEGNNMYLRVPYLLPQQ